MPLVALELVPQPRHWAASGSWRDNVFEMDSALGEHAPILVSPEFELEADRLVTFCFSGFFIGEATFSLQVRERPRGVRLLARSYPETAGEARMALAFRAPASGRYQVVLEHVRHPARARVGIAAPSFLAQAIGEGRVATGRLADDGPGPEESGEARYLPHWNRLQRFIHRRCRASRAVNAFVAAVEMRLEREELLSLPQYMGVCPTGQCNATCDFCSVTINRTGIIKKQLPFQRLEAFLAPVANTLQMVGIEGNGEPTLYTRFPELVERLTRGGANAYLITNGSRLKADEAALLLALESVNFSLNAATAQTHRRVMKLDNFDEIVGVIGSLARSRGLRELGGSPGPTVVVCFVVTADNVHEVQDFLRLAEQDLGVDVVMVRPLAELGNDLGVVEDLRRIVPYESDVRDMIESVREYVTDVTGAADIRLVPETFRSSRPDPVGRVVMPLGFEDRLLAPRRADWRASDSQIAVVWTLNRARLMLPAARDARFVSLPVPTPPGRRLLFKARIGVTGGPARLAISDRADRVIAEVLLADTGGRIIPVELVAATGDGGALSIAVIGAGRACTLEIDFERLRTPAPYIQNAFQIPAGRRWETCAPDADVTWTGDALAIRSPAGGRPYLLKSYAIACAQQASIAIPVEVEVAVGEIEIGVLDAAGASFLQSFRFADGRACASVFFDTGANEVVRLVVSAEPDRPVDATIAWGQPRIVAGGDAAEDSIRLPTAQEWFACVPAVRLQRGDDRLSLSWDGAGSPYLLKSNRVRCARDQRARTPIVVEVTEGEIGVGVVGAGGGAWLMLRTFEQGLHRVDLEYDTHDNESVCFVLSAVEGESVVARVGLSAEALADSGPPVPRAGQGLAASRAASAGLEEALRIPPEGRWQICAPDATVNWDGEAIRFSATTGGRPYLLKSAAIRCAQETPVEIPVRVQVLRGAMEIGVLNASGSAYLRNFRFAEGRTDAAIFFDTGANAAVRLVISATPGLPVEAVVGWGRPRRAAEDPGSSEALRAPDAPGWTACVPTAQVSRNAGELAVRWAGEGGPYLLRSNDVRCRPGQRARAAMAIAVDEGTLGVGVLAAGGGAWLTTQILSAGTQGVALEFETGACDAVSFVLFAVKSAAVAARVSFPSEHLEPADFVRPKERAEEPVAAAAASIALSRAGPATPTHATSGAPAAVEAAAAEATALPSLAMRPVGLGARPPVTPRSPRGRGAGRAAPAPSGNIIAQAAKWARGGTRHYCQKPWTDMSNFTVDGRVDVCCIATGASQEAYQLGNINRQSFQEIWNGPMAREFRRTVNGEDKLHPCARCPMSHAYNGLLFDPENTLDSMNVWVVRLLRKRKLTWLIAMAVSFNRMLVDRVMFRGFKRRGNRVI